MKTILLSRKQIETLAQIADHFKDINQFTIKETNESGIGPTTTVSFDLFDNEVKIDNTDVDTW